MRLSFRVSRVLALTGLLGLPALTRAAQAQAPGAPPAPVRPAPVRSTAPAAVVARAHAVEGALGAQTPRALERFHVAARTQWAERGRVVAGAVLRGAGVGTGTGVAGAHAVAGGTSLTGNGTPVSGVLRQVLVRVAFSDEPFPYDSANVAARYYGPGRTTQYSLPRYYQEASGGRFTVQGAVTTTVTLPHPSSYYVGARSVGRYNGVADSLDVFLRDVFRAVDSTTNLAPYADSSDAARRVAALVILQPGQGGECGNAGGGLWAHRYTASEALGAPYATRSTVNGVAVTIDDYILNAAASCDVPGQLGGPGTVIHETAHLLGLPDLYDTGSGGGRNPVGQWDLMGWGNYTTPDTPAMLGAWSRWVLGWATATTLTIPTAPGDSLAGSIGPSVSSGKIVRIPYRNTGEFLLLETRVRAGSDLALPEEGMLVWYVNPAVATVSAVRENRVNTSTLVPGVGIVQPDGRRDLDLATDPFSLNHGDTGDIWPGGFRRTRFDASTDPAWRSLVTNAPQGRLDHIAFENNFSTFSLSSGDSVPVVVPGDTTHGYGRVRVVPDTLPQGVAGLAYGPVTFGLAGADTARLAGATVAWSTDTVALRNLGLTLGERTAGGPTDGPTGPAGPVISGTLSETAQTTTLVVRAAITGTRGDTTLTQSYTFTVLGNDRLGLPRLVRALLDPAHAALTPAQARFYDLRGNRSGAYDLGDLVRALAQGLVTWSPGTPIPAPPAARP